MPLWNVLPCWFSIICLYQYGNMSLLNLRASTELEGTGGKLSSIPGTKLNNSDPKVRVVDTEVVRDAPHDYQMDILLLEFPGNGATSPSEPAVFIIHHHHHLTVAGEPFSLVVT